MYVLIIYLIYKLLRITPKKVLIYAFVILTLIGPNIRASIEQGKLVSVSSVFVMVIFNSFKEIFALIYEGAMVDKEFRMYVLIAIAILVAILTVIGYIIYRIKKAKTVKMEKALAEKLERVYGEQYRRNNEPAFGEKLIIYPKDYEKEGIILPTINDIEYLRNPK